MARCGDHPNSMLLMQMHALAGHRTSSSRAFLSLSSSRLTCAAPSSNRSGPPVGTHAIVLCTAAVLPCACGSCFSNLQRNPPPTLWKDVIFWKLDTHLCIYTINLQKIVCTCVEIAHTCSLRPPKLRRLGACLSVCWPYVQVQRPS